MNKVYDITTKLRGDGTGNILYVVMHQDGDHNLWCSKNHIWRAKNETHLKNMISKRIYNEDASTSDLNIDIQSGKVQITKIGKMHYHPSTPGMED